MMTLTLDTNCIIDLELNESAASELRRLLAKHDASQIDLQVAGMMASERLRAGGYSTTFSGFSERINRLSPRPIRVLKPIGRWDLTYWSEGLWADDSMTSLEARIHSILFRQPYQWADIALQEEIDPGVVTDENNREWRKWRNRLCDTSAMWCHIYYGGDMFVTRDPNFLKSKRIKLEALGANRIVSPADACKAAGA